MKVKPVTMKALARIEVNARVARDYRVEDGDGKEIADWNGLIASLVETVYKYRRENKRLLEQLRGGR